MAPARFIVVRCCPGTGAERDSPARTDAQDQRHVGPRSPVWQGQRRSDQIALNIRVRGLAGLSFCRDWTQSCQIMTETADALCPRDDAAGCGPFLNRIVYNSVNAS